MNVQTFKLYCLCASSAALLCFVGALLIKEPFSILLFTAAALLFIGVIVALLRKIRALQQQNSAYLERFTVSLAHVSNVLFDNVLEADITNDCLIGENCQKLTQLLQIPASTSYSEIIRVISQKMVDPAFSEEYRRVLSRENVLATLAQGQNILEFECIERSDGENYRWIRVHYCIYLSKITNCVHVISYVKNIEEEKRAYIRLIEKASTDQMTGLLNKTAIKETVQDLLHKYPDESHMVLMVDIDDFKKINDCYGHAAGDEVLVALCNMMKTIFRDSAIIGRMGGDEFLLAMRGPVGHEMLETKVKQLLSAVQECCFVHDGQEIKNITVSIGSVQTFQNDNFDQLYHYADTAMYKAKAMGKNQYVVYTY